MKKRLIFLLICVISTVFTSFAQRNLEVKDVSSGLNVFLRKIGIRRKEKQSST